MKKTILKTVATISAAGLVGMLASGCAHHVVVTEGVEAPAGEVVVSTAPPPPRREVVTVAPGPSYVWTQGYWVRSRGRWVWVPGRYALRPQPRAVWVSGHWDHTNHGWIWTPGRWS